MSLEKTFQEDLAKKYDKNLEQQLRQWMAPYFEKEPKFQKSILDFSIPFVDLLKDGEILCQ